MHSFFAVNFMLHTLHTNYGVNFNFINDSLHLIVNSEEYDGFLNFLFEPGPNYISKVHSILIVQAFKNALKISKLLNKN